MEPNSEVNLVENVASIDLCTDASTGNDVATSNSDSFQGGRMGKLRKAMDKTTEHCLSLLSFTVLKKHMLQHKSSEDRQTLQRLHAEMLQKLSANIKDEIKLMLEEENIEKLLADLEDLCTTPSFNQAWRPSGIPEDDVAAHLVHALTTLLNKLQSVSAEVDIENDRLCRAVTERRRLVESLKNEAAENKMKLMQLANNWEEWTNKTSSQ